MSEHAPTADVREGAKKLEETRSVRGHVEVSYWGGEGGVAVFTYDDESISVSARKSNHVYHDFRQRHYRWGGMKYTEIVVIYYHESDVA